MNYAITNNSGLELKSVEAHFGDFHEMTLGDLLPTIESGCSFDAKIPPAFDATITFKVMPAGTEVERVVPVTREELTDKRSLLFIIGPGPDFEVTRGWRYE